MGRMTRAPRERWRMSTGADVSFARAVRARDGEGLLVLAGSLLQRVDANGNVRWRLGVLGASYVEHVGDMDGTGTPCALVKTDARTLVLIDVASGEECWRWVAPPGTFVGDGAGFKVEAGPSGAALYLFPTYATEAWCFDFAAGRRTPDLRWHRGDLPYDAGFGPSVVLADMDGDGRRELLLSSRIGADYRSNPRTGRTTTSEIVLGRRDGEVWQAVLDPADGRVVVETRFEAVPGAPHDSARPYGLLHASPLEPDELPSVVLVSCQVEEFAVVTHRTSTGSLRRHDGWFVEKDWPNDERELRPQPTSLADLRGDGRPMLVVGLWQDGAWRTLVLDPRGALDDPIATIPGRYFWGCHDVDGDGRPEILTSRETHRTPRARSTLEAWRGTDVRRIATLTHASILASTNSPLPPDVAFMANRRNAIAVSIEDGRTGVLVRRGAADGPAVGAWAGAGGGPPEFVPLLQGAFDRADAAGDAIVFADAAGRVAQVGFDGRAVFAPIEVNGRLATPLAGPADAWGLVVDRAGGEVVGGRPVDGGDRVLDGAWSVQGSLPALDIDVDAARSRLVVADDSDPDRPSMAIHGIPSGRVPPRRVRLPAPAYLGIVPLDAGGGYLVNLRTGVHTMSLERRDRVGRLRWRDSRKGAYLRPPGVDVVDGALVVIADDHGELRRYDGAGAVAWMSDWTAAYTMPIPGPWGPDGAWAILRAGGIHGLELLDAGGATIWRTEAELWEYASNTPAVGWLGDPRVPVLGAVTRGGWFQCIDVRSGVARWAIDLGCAANGTSVVAADLDGDGSDEFVTGLPDGRLVCLGETAAGRGAERWSVAFDVAVGNPIVVDLDGDGAAELVVATADGDVLWLR